MLSPTQETSYCSQDGKWEHDKHRHAFNSDDENGQSINNSCQEFDDQPGGWRVEGVFAAGVNQLGGLGDHTQVPQIMTQHLVVEIGRIICLAAVIGR
ncbi:MAG: hypothetical protein ACK2UM_06070 [Anaerolineales bacterium]